MFVYTLETAKKIRGNGRKSFIRKVALPAHFPMQNFRNIRNHVQVLELYNIWNDMLEASQQQTLPGKRVQIKFVWIK